MVKNGIYKHFKGGEVLVFGVANTPEDSLDVLYRGMQNGKIYARPIESFLDEVKNADGEIVLLHKFQVRISAYVFPEEPVTPTESLYGKYSARGDLVAGHFFDELDTRTGSDKVGAIFSPGGSAFWNRNANVVPPVDTLRYWGWISVIGEFGELGYQFDGEDAVFDASFAVAAEDGLGAAVGVGVVCDAVSRVEVLVPVGELSGTNHVDILYKAPDGTIVSLFKFVINIGE